MKKSHKKGAAVGEVEATEYPLSPEELAAALGYTHANTGVLVCNGYLRAQRMREESSAKVAYADADAVARLTAPSTGTATASASTAAASAAAKASRAGGSDAKSAKAGKGVVAFDTTNGVLVAVKPAVYRIFSFVSVYEQARSLRRVCRLWRAMYLPNTSPVWREALLQSPAAIAAAASSSASKGDSKTDGAANGLLLADALRVQFGGFACLLGLPDDTKHSGAAASAADTKSAAAKPSTATAAASADAAATTNWYAVVREQFTAYRDSARDRARRAHIEVFRAFCAENALVRECMPTPAKLHAWVSKTVRWCTLVLTDTAPAQPLPALATGKPAAKRPGTPPSNAKPSASAAAAAAAPVKHRLPVGSTKYGGWPDLPAHLSDEWFDGAGAPRTRPTTLLLQLDLQQYALHGHAHNPLPRRGLLYVWRLSGYPNVSVSYYDGPRELLRRASHAQRRRFRLTGEIEALDAPTAPAAASADDDDADPDAAAARTRAAAEYEEWCHSADGQGARLVDELSLALSTTFGEGVGAPRLLARDWNAYARSKRPEGEQGGTGLVLLGNIRTDNSGSGERFEDPNAIPALWAPGHERALVTDTDSRMNHLYATHGALTAADWVEHITACSHD